MSKIGMDLLRHRGAKLLFCAQRKGVDWTKQGIWFILVKDLDGDYCSVGLERNALRDGKRNGPDGAILDQDEPRELIALLKQAGFQSVQLFKLVAQKT